jgi:membrane protein DedA with SNARE-associated domain
VRARLSRSLGSVLVPDARAAWHWISHLGGPGLVVLGLIDNSFVPVPGSMDALTVVLAAKQRQWWPYYSAMATLGAVIGGYLTYRLARRQGKQALERRIRKSRMDKAYGAFERWGFAAITVPALLPPPMPMVPFLVAAGALQYPRSKFLAALSLGRAIRYFSLGLLAAVYGRQIFHWFAEYGYPLLYASIAAGILIAIVLLLRWRRAKAVHHRAT